MVTIGCGYEVNGALRTAQGKMHNCNRAKNARRRYNHRALLATAVRTISALEKVPDEFVCSKF